MGEENFSCLSCCFFYSLFSINSGHEQDFLWPLVVSVAVIILLQVAHQLLIGKPAPKNRQLVSVSVFYHASLDDWDESTDAQHQGSSSDEEEEIHLPSTSLVFALGGEALLELGFGLVLGACWATMSRLGLLMAAAMGIQLLFTKMTVAAIVSTSVSGKAVSFFSNVAPALFLFVGLIAGVAAPQGSTSAAVCVKSFEI